MLNRLKKLRLQLFIVFAFMSLSCRHIADEQHQLAAEAVQIKDCCYCQKEYYAKARDGMADIQGYLKKDSLVSSKSFLGVQAQDKTCEQTYGRRRGESSSEDYDYYIYSQCHSVKIKGVCSFGAKEDRDAFTANGHRILAPSHSTNSQLPSELNETNTCPQEPSSSSCSFYKCLEKDMHCGTQGYPLQYGLKYCNRFQKQCDHKLTSINARKWLAATTLCLQKSLIRFQRECSDLIEQAFNSHVYCYTEGARRKSGVSICMLSQQEWLDIATCVDSGDIFSTRSAKQMSAAAAHCARYYMNLSNSFMLANEDKVKMFEELAERFANKAKEIDEKSDKN